MLKYFNLSQYHHHEELSFFVRLRTKSVYLIVSEMSLTLRMEELGRVRVFADLDGRMSLSLKPVEEINDTQGSASGVLIHFDTIVENGSSKLHIFKIGRAHV